MYDLWCCSPIGCLHLSADEEALTAIALVPEEERGRDLPSALLLQAKKELSEYFSGARQTFSVPLAPRGTDFQRRVWQVLSTIPYGETLTYGEVAARLGNKQASRAVGGAVGKNPLLIMIPCHRVLAAGGHIGGFSCGVEIKKMLHEIEKIEARG